MSRRTIALALAVAVAACSSKKAPDPGPAQRYPIVPNVVLGQLGDVGFVLAVDLPRLDLAKLDSMIPAELGCIRDQLHAAKVAVVSEGVGDVWEGRITGLTDAGTRDCIAATAKAFGVTAQRETDGTTTLAVPDDPVSLSWHGDEVTIAQKGQRVRNGPPPGVITDLLASVPKDAKGWIVSAGLPKYKIKSLIAWLDTTATTWTFTISVEAIELGAVKPWLESVIHGFRGAAEAKGVAVDESWFKLDATPSAGKLVVTIPIAAFVPTR